MENMMIQQDAETATTTRATAEIYRSKVVKIARFKPFQTLFGRYKRKYPSRIRKPFAWNSTKNYGKYYKSALYRLSILAKVTWLTYITFPI